MTLRNLKRINDQHVTTGKLENALEKELQDQIDAFIAYGEWRERNKRIPLTGDRREQLELEPRGLQGPEVGTTELPHKEGGSAEGIRERPPMLEFL